MLPSQLQLVIRQQLMLKRLDNIDVYCTDLGPMVEFYRAVLGLEFNLPYEEGQGWAGFTAGDVTIYLIETPSPDHAPPRGGQGQTPPGIDSFAFEVDDLEAAIAELDLRGARWAGDIVESPWYRYRGLHDPEGNLLYVTRPDRTALGLAEPR
jgi:catechol 2,3-dioxygenase-like lactoylglutathione lyase family enzyme